jgi:hypothetical protein
MGYILRRTMYIYIMYWDNIYIPTGRVVDSSAKLGVQATT